MRLKLTGKHSSHVGKRRVGAACASLHWQRRPLLAAPLRGEGGGLFWIWLEDNEELHRVSDGETHRSLVLSCKERWLRGLGLGLKWVLNCLKYHRPHPTTTRTQTHTATLPSLVASLYACPSGRSLKPLSSASFHECQDAEFKVC